MAMTERMTRPSSGRRAGLEPVLALKSACDEGTGESCGVRMASRLGSRMIGSTEK